MKKAIKKSLALFMSLAMVLGAVVIFSPTATVSAETTDTVLFDVVYPNGAYKNLNLIPAQVLSTMHF